MCRLQESDGEVFINPARYTETFINLSEENGGKISLFITW